MMLVPEHSTSLHCVLQVSIADGSALTDTGQLQVHTSVCSLLFCCLADWRSAGVALPELCQPKSVDHPGENAANNGGQIGF